MVCIASLKDPAPASKYLSDSVALPSEKLYTPEGIKLINDFLIRFCATGITCISETVACWINDNRRVLPPEVAVWLPPNRTIKDLTSKLNQIEVARKVGFKVLPTYLINENPETSNCIPKNHFPLCLRPDDPATMAPVFKVHLVHSQLELINYVKSMQKMDSPIVAQPFMPLPNLVVHGARTVNGNSKGLHGFLVERKFEGVTLTIRPAHLEKNFLDKCVQFTDYFNLIGNYHFEFLVDRTNGSTYFLELNNRLGGTTAKVFALGYDEPLLALQAYGAVPFLDQPSNVDYRPENKIVSSKQALLKYFYYTLRGRLTPLDYPSEPSVVRIAKTVYGFLRYKDDVFTLRDIKGSMALYFGNLKNKISG